MMMMVVMLSPSRNFGSEVGKSEIYGLGTNDLGSIFWPRLNFRRQPPLYNVQQLKMETLIQFCSSHAHKRF